MSLEDAEDSAPMVSTDSEINELMGLFDVPAFARRGQDAEYSVNQVHTRCQNQREEFLVLIRMRLRQWSRVACGPLDWAATFREPIIELWELTGAEPGAWAGRSAPERQRRVVARDLIASVQRFNVRWREFLSGLKLEAANRVIDQYNRYYVLEKECVLGSARLATRHFQAIPCFSSQTLLATYPLLPVPALISPAQPGAAR